MSNAQDYIDTATSMVAELHQIQDKLKPDLANVKVKISKSDNPDIYKSIEEIFGDRSNSPDKDFITFEMYTKCMEIIRAGGAATGSDLLRNNKIV